MDQSKEKLSVFCKQDSSLKKNLFNVSFQQLENDLRLDESSAVWHKSNKSNLATAFVQPLSHFFGVRLLCKRPKKEIGQLGILLLEVRSGGKS